MTLNNIILRRIGLRLMNELRKAAPSDTGRLRSSIRVILTPRGLRIIMVDYGKYVEFGTPPHVIKPKSKKALKFKGPKGDVIVRKVNHPGTRPNPFIRSTLFTKLPKIISEEIVR